MNNEDQPRTRAIARLEQLMPLVAAYVLALETAQFSHQLDEAQATWEVERTIPAGFAALELRAWSEVLREREIRGVPRTAMISFSAASSFRMAADRLEDPTRPIGPAWVKQILSELQVRS